MRQGIADSVGVVDVWPCSQTPLRVFAAMLTQFRRDANSRPTGLDYAALPVVEKRLSIRKKERKNLFSDLQIMECEALDEMNRAYERAVKARRK